MERWHDAWGDRRHELVFIGTREMDQASIEEELNACLVKAPSMDALKSGRWISLKDPFPAWRRE